jgi:hypothetical protein
LGVAKVASLACGVDSDRGLLVADDHDLADVVRRVARILAELGMLEVDERESGLRQASDRLGVVLDESELATVGELRRLNGSRDHLDRVRDPCSWVVVELAGDHDRQLAGLFVDAHVETPSNPWMPS